MIAVNTDIGRSSMIQNDTESFSNSEDAVQFIFNSNKCYELLPNSCKVVVFESAISFQLAFYALVEHDGEVAPIWDPVRKTFLGLMTTTDFIESLRLCNLQGIPPYDLASRSISEMLQVPKPDVIIKHNNFVSVDAESSVFQMCCLLYNMNTDYLPIVDTVENNIVGVLGYLDALYLLAHCAQQYPQVAAMTVGELSTLPTVENANQPQLTAPKNAFLHSVLAVLHERQLPCIPILDDDGRVLSLYQKSDIAFLSRATNPDLVINNFANLTIFEVIQQQQMNETSTGPAPTGFCQCYLTTNIKDLLDSMINYRTSRSVCVDETGGCVCVVEVKDILRHFLRATSQPQSPPAPTSVLRPSSPPVDV